MKRGRSKTLLDSRNKKLVDRYFYWTEVERLRFDDAIKKLSEEEFFISEICVVSVIRKYEEYYKQLQANKTKQTFKLFKTSKN